MPPVLKQTPDFDLAVIGGGPGGSTAAALARRHNLKVLVVEKERFPRFHIGESLLPMGNALLRESGAWPRLEAAGFIRKYGASFHLANGAAMTRIDFSEGLVPGLDYTFQVERSKFDSLLLDNARESGAEVRMETTARSGGVVDGIHQLRLETTAGLQTVTARWVFDASGRDQIFQAGRKRPLDPSPFPKRVAVYNHFRGVARSPGRPGGDTLAIRLENGWFWLIPIDAERTSVGLVTTVEAMREARLPPEELFARAVAASVTLRDLFVGSEPVGPFRVTSDYSYFLKDLSRDRLVLVGDAAGFFDPIFSSGVYMSMLSAKLAVAMMVRADAEGRGLTVAESRQYADTVKRHAGVFQKLIAVYYNNDSFAVFMCKEVPWRIRSAICSIVAGNARLTWPLWWRFRVFLLVCWMQKRWTRICPSLDYGEVAANPARSTASPQ
jgi:flavin-dependent dehydrogenase